MFGKILKEKSCALAIKQGTGYAIIQKLVAESFFDSPVSSEEVAYRISEKLGVKWRISHVQTYVKKFQQAGIVHAVRPVGSRRNYWVLTNVSRAEALQLIGKTHKVREIQEKLFSEDLMRKLRKNLNQELGELHENFGRNGDCTAFLLRKMLEKLIIIAFAKTGRDALLHDAARPGGYRGLKDMIEISAREKVNGVPILIPKTAHELKGLKFLGDTAAHNPLVNVDMTTIIPQMPFMITAYKELAQRL